MARGPVRGRGLPARGRARGVAGGAPDAKRSCRYSKSVRFCRGGSWRPARNCAGRGSRPAGTRGGTPKKGLRSLTDAFASDIAAEIDALAGAGAADGIDFERLETSVRRRAFGPGGAGGGAAAERGTERPGGTTLPCGCGGRASYAGRRAKTMTAVLGDLRLERACYYCPSCNAGFHPYDRALGIEGASLSPVVVRMTGLAAARASFAETGALLHDLTGVNVDAKQAERTAEALGRAVPASSLRLLQPLDSNCIFRFVPKRVRVSLRAGSWGSREACRGFAERSGSRLHVRGPQRRSREWIEVPAVGGCRRCEE